MEDENTVNPGPIQWKPSDIVVGAALAYSAYTIVRLGYDWTKVGVTALKNRKKNQNEN